MGDASGWAGAGIGPTHRASLHVEQVEAVRGLEQCDRGGRIEAIPETRLCVEHARMIAKYGGEFLVTATRKSLGKAGSLKMNYGDIATHKTRNRTAIERLRRVHQEG